MLADKDVIRAGKGKIRAFNGASPFNFFEYKNIVKANLNLMDSFQETIYLK